MRGVLRASLAIALLLLAGCVRTVAPLEPGSALELGRPVVIAFIDMGINPYHEAFRLATDDPRVDFQGTLRDSRSGRTAAPLTLSLGLDYEDAVSRDAQILDQVEAGRLYSLTGTNLLAISFDETAPAGTPLLDDPDIRHGTLVAGVAQKTAPGIVIVAIEAVPRYCDVRIGETCVFSPTVVAAAEWVADQPWIDVLSLSFSPQANHPAPELEAFAVATRRAVESGKIVVAAAGNSPPPGVVNGANSPPWVISVGGAQEERHGAAVLAATYPDVAANYTWMVPSSVSTNKSREGSGTSLAAPRVAGVLAKALAEVRGDWRYAEGLTSDGALALSPGGDRATAWDFRAALNASARVWNTTDWQPRGPETDPPDTIVHATIPIMLPAAHVGWGFVDNATAHEIAARVLARDFTLPAAKEGAHRAAVESAYAARVEYWTARPAS